MRLLTLILAVKSIYEMTLMATASESDPTRTGVSCA